jgi:N-acetylmuramoyl-L-alanine amidase
LSRSALPGIADRPSPNHGERRDGLSPDILLLHYTATKSAENAIRWLCNPDAQASSHYVVDVDGAITRLVEEDRRAWHAGASFWKGETDVNSRSIGIEIQNEGNWGGNPDFPEPQMRAVEALCLDILARHAIAPERVLAHSDVAPGRKVDPGEKFDWARLARAGIGRWVEPAPITPGPALDLGDAGEEVRALQSALAAYGYKVEASGLFEPATKSVVRAFQLHFRQGLVDGVADVSTRDTLARLGANA